MTTAQVFVNLMAAAPRQHCAHLLHNTLCITKAHVPPQPRTSHPHQPVTTSYLFSGVDSNVTTCFSALGSPMGPRRRRACNKAWWQAPCQAGGRKGEAPACAVPPLLRHGP